MRSGVRRGMVAATLTVVVLSFAWSGAAGAQSGGDDAKDPPRATLSAGGGAPGGTVEVRGSGWPAESIVQAQVCGNLHLNGSNDCMRANAVTKAVNPDGGFAVTLTINVPPTPCPCVVAVSTFDGRFPIDLPYEVTGAPTATPKRSEAKVPEFRLLKTHVVDEPSLGSKFGLADTRVVASTIRNVGTSPIAALPVTVTFGPGDDPSKVVATRTVKNLEPGAERTIRVQVSIPALSAGSYSAVVTAGEGNRAVSEATSIPTFPWLLALLVAVLGIVVLVVIFVRLSRSRRTSPPPAAPVAGGPEPGSYDPDALEADLAGSLQDALLGVPASMRAASPDQVANQVAPRIAAALAARHHLDATVQASLEAGIRSELAASLAAPPVVEPPGASDPEGSPVSASAGAAGDGA